MLALLKQIFPRWLHWPMCFSFLSSAVIPCAVTWMLELAICRKMESPPNKEDSSEFLKISISVLRCEQAT